MTRLTEDPTTEHKTAAEAGNEENSKHMSSIPDHGLVPPVRAGACRAHPAKEAPDREEAARRQELETKLPLLFMHLYCKMGEFRAQDTEHRSPL